MSSKLHSLSPSWSRGIIIMLIVALTANNSNLFGQTLPKDTLNKKRLALVLGGSGVGYTGMLIGLNKLWYQGYPKSNFHFINDNGEWLQIDKVGHMWSSYAYGIAGIEGMKWTGMERKKAIIIGGLAGTLFQTPIEILDGYSAEWGASAGDLVANSLGSVLAIGQELLWDEQRIQLKYSYWFTSYAALRPELLGGNLAERWMKDYNGHTGWLSVNPSSFGASFFPKWMSLSIGYGGDGMLGGYDNRWTDKNTGIVYDYTGIQRRRQAYLSVDV
ncbi:MAG: YfiM family protein, partial [Bacteroidota bacterium]|nr:YfiM family protein [Bacteroidota bacterium]MDX5431133.1 YfiM family protein [Bacteroidota bacterium]MDX5469880.1 YfiM family protein [Bacteroidota bacterium]